MKNYRRLRWLYLACHIAFVFALFYATLSHWLMAIIAYLVLQVIGVGIGLHRYLAHRAFVTKVWKHKLLLILSALSAMGSPISWAAIHRLHHLTSDTERDPHSYHFMGIKKILLGSYNKEVSMPSSMVKDLVKDKWLLWIHRNYFLLLFIWATLLLVLGFQYFLFIFCIPIVFVYWANSLGIVLNHWWGYRNFETKDHSVNSWILSLYTLGDGWHNNHHKHANNYTHKVKWWEFDLCAFIIKYFLKSKDRLVV